jgi:hypothetical protein
MSGSRLSLIAVSGLMIGLTACGGGGSGGGSTAPVAVTISSANATQVAGAAVDTTTGSGYAVMGVQTSVSAPAPSLVSAVQSVAKIGEAAVQQAIAQGAAPATVTGAVTTSPCVYGGTSSVNLTSATAGTITFNNCSDIAGITDNGTLSFSNVVVTGSLYSADHVYNLTSTYSSPYLANTSTTTGDMRVSNLDLNTGAGTISGSSLSITNTDPTLGNFVLRNYSITTDSTGHNTAMTFTFTAPGGTATFTMITPFVKTGGIFPSTGAATITGAGSTVLRFTVLGDERAVGNQVMLELSTNGGTTYAAPVYVTWASISSLI